MADWKNHSKPGFSVSSVSVRPNAGQRFEGYAYTHAKKGPPPWLGWFGSRCSPSEASNVNTGACLFRILNSELPDASHRFIAYRVDDSWVSVGAEGSFRVNKF